MTQIQPLDYLRLQHPQRHVPAPRDAAWLDRLADIELQHGHLAAADRLAWLAADLREVAP